MASPVPTISLRAERDATHPLLPALNDAFAAVMRDEVTLPDFLLDMPGMSGRRYRMLINRLVRNLAAPRYLEVGSWKGSTLCAAIHDNKVSALAIDNWSEFGGPFAEFLAHLAQSRSHASPVSFLEQDFRTVRFDALGPFDIYLFDGPHTADDQYDGIVMAQPALAEEHILVVDDWNLVAARAGTQRAIAELGLTVAGAIEIRTAPDDIHPEVHGAASDWHNGYFIAALRKARSSARASPAPPAKPARAPARLARGSPRTRR
jgi:hypothetical protein